MARIERDREDLLAEATALVQRVELALPDVTEHVFAGFRPDGCGSVYFGPDEAYQFNTAGELRRAHRDAVLYKSQRGRLIALRRQREEGQVALVRHELEDPETEQFIQHMQSRLDALRAALKNETFDVIGQVPADADVTGRVHEWLIGLPSATVARSPHAR